MSSKARDHPMEWQVRQANRTLKEEIRLAVARARATAVSVPRRVKQDRGPKACGNLQARCAVPRQALRTTGATPERKRPDCHRCTSRKCSLGEGARSLKCNERCQRVSRVVELSVQLAPHAKEQDCRRARRLIGGAGCTKTSTGLGFP